MNIQQLRAQIAALQDATMDEDKNFHSSYDEGKFDAFSAVDALLDSLEEEPVSNDLEIASVNYAATGEFLPNGKEMIDFQLEKAFKAGAQWQKANLWKPADGDDLPNIDREVIVLYQRHPMENNEYAVGFAHRPKEYWEGKNIETDEVTRYYPKRYDKGGWNSPNIKYWLDWELPIQKGE